MALVKLRKTETETPDAFEPPQVMPLGDDAEYAAAVKLLTALKARETRRQEELERLALESHFENRPNGTSDGPRDARLRERLTKLQALPAYWRGNDDPAPLDIPPVALARGVALLRGEDVSPEMSRAERLARLHREGQTLDEAIRHQDGVVERRRGDLSHEVCQGLKAHHDTVLLEFYRAAQALSAITDKEREFRAAVLMAGYEISPHVISPPFISAPLLLGSERQWDSQISAYRRFLEKMGVVS